MEYGDSFIDYFGNTNLDLSLGFRIQFKVQSEPNTIKIIYEY